MQWLINWKCLVLVNAHILDHGTTLALKYGSGSAKCFIFGSIIINHLLDQTQHCIVERLLSFIALSLYFEALTTPLIIHSL